jgi:hypothetical protein
MKTRKPTGWAGVVYLLINLLNGDTYVGKTAKDDAEKYDIWGHALDDLILEGVEAATPTLILLTVSPA